MIGKVLEWVQGAHPVFYFGLLILAGLGIPVSEDGLVIWAGGLLGRGENPYPPYQYVIALYLGAVMSDMLTFSVGRLTQHSLGTRIQNLLFKDPRKIEKAMVTIRKYGNKAGFIQRFSVGARLPITFFSGYSGIHPLKCMLGTALGACITLPIQLGVGYAMRNQIAQALGFLNEYGGIVAVLILATLGFVLYRKIFATKGVSEDPPGGAET
jgi:membrane protein DedA with SNARE-associated domain